MSVDSDLVRQLQTAWIRAAGGATIWWVVPTQAVRVQRMRVVFDQCVSARDEAKVEFNPAACEWHFNQTMGRFRLVTETQYREPRNTRGHTFSVVWDREA